MTKSNRLGHSLMMLALEANHVIGLRLMKLMRGGRARRESQLMINEKIDAAFKAGASIVAGASADKVVRDIGVEWLQMRRG
jgi:hypothetical protein